MDEIALPGEGDLLAGRYRLERHLGQGGMGTVWLAMDAELDDLPVAIKMIRPELAGDIQFIAGLKAEAKSSLALTHPHIVRVFNFHRDETNPDLTFLVLKFIGGETMKEHLARSPQGLAPERVLRWADQIAAAIDYAHGTGVLHRDIKPSNIMIDESGETAYLMDFGISRQAGATMAGLTAGSSVGTPAYMSPQQLHEKDCNSNDIYSFAATVYEALCGRPPFGGADIEEQILRVNAKPIPGIADTVNEGLLAGLSKIEEDRPATATEFVEWMLHGVNGQAVIPPSAPPASNVQTSESRSHPDESASRSPVGLIASTVVLASGFLAGRASMIATPIHDVLGMRTAAVAPPTRPASPAPSPAPSPNQTVVKTKPERPRPSNPDKSEVSWDADDAPEFIELVRTRQTDALRAALESAETSDTLSSLLKIMDPNTGFTPLLEAASQGDVPIIELLTEFGADLTQTGAIPLRKTALHVAVESKRLAAIEKLIELGISVNVEDESQTTPLHIAAKATLNARDLEILRALIDAGADPSLMNKQGKTPAELVPRTSSARDEAMALLQP